MFNVVIVFTGMLLTIVILILDNSGKESIGLLQLVVIDFISIFFLSFFTKDKSKLCLYAFVLVIIIHILLFNNTSGWNEGSMSGGKYIIPFFKNATDTLYSLILFSAFLLLIPIVIYVIFIKSLIGLFCNSENKRLDNYSIKYPEKKINLAGYKKFEIKDLIFFIIFLLIIPILIKLTQLSHIKPNSF